MTWRQSLMAAWQHRGWLARALWPVAWGVGCWLRLRDRHTAPVTYPASLDKLPPWITVGNVVVGGAGKTPTTLALVRHFQAMGRRPGVVSKGHGRQLPRRRPDAPQLVSVDSDPHRCGDEPLLVHQATRAPVAVGPDRVEAARWLLQQHPEVDVLIGDDGLQDRRVQPTVRLVVFDDRGIGNGWLLPAGMLRQPWPPARPEPDTWVLRTAPAPNLHIPAGLPVFDAERRLKPVAVNPLGEECALTDLATTGPSLALAGIARPERFFAMLTSAGIQPQDTWGLPDHHAFNDEFCSSLRLTDLPKRLFFTEKDAVKLFPWLRAMNPPYRDAWCVGLDVTLPPALLSALDARLSSTHGLQSA